LIFSNSQPLTMSSSSSTSQTEAHTDSPLSASQSSQASQSRASSPSNQSSSSSRAGSASESTPVTERLPVEAPTVVAANTLPMTPMTAARKRPDTRGLGSIPGARGLASPMIAPAGERGGRASIEGRESIDTDFQEDVKPTMPAGRKCCAGSSCRSLNA
jgi:hypothetical protein